MARTSARSSATRDQASSPPKQSSDRQSQSPVGRRTRSARSQSADLGENNLTTTTKRGDKRGARQASVESASSNTSAASSRGGRTRKTTRATRATPADRELSMVAEDRELEEEEHGEDEEEDEGAARAQRSNSPGAMSQMSGTTAISSFSARTSHSQGEIGALDPMVAEILPDLWSTSYSILNLLAPMDASENQVESIVRELKAPGSRLSKSLRYDEEKFGISRQHYGNENYIKTTLIFRRLLGSAEPDEGDFRPDAIIHAANIATLVKDFLVIQKESQSTRSILMGLDSYFPEVFVTRFDDDIRFGNSLLLDESFDLALDIRTQFTITALGFQKEQEKWDPDQILAATFYDPPSQRNPPLSYFEDSIRNGRPKNIMGTGLPTNDHQNNKVLDRVRLIHSAFRQSNDAHEVGDLVDFEQLEELFPWVKFLTDLVNWSRLRLEEISGGIKQQGGVKAITRSFIEAIKSSDSQVDINYDPSPLSVTGPRQLKPSAEIVPGPSGQSLYNGDPNMVRRLEQLKRMSSTLDALPPSQQKASAAASSSAPEPKSGHQGTARTMASKNIQDASQQEIDDFRPDVDDGYGDEPRPSVEFVQSWSDYRGDRNKENRPELRQTTKASLFDRQPGAKRVPWNGSQGSQAGPSTQKRARKEPDPEEDDEEQEADQEEQSEDEGFERDRRDPDPGRRATAPTARRKSPEPDDTHRLPKRQRVERPTNGERAAREDAQRRQQREETSSQGSGRPEAYRAEDEEYHPVPTFTQVSAAARLNGVRSRINNEPQRRTPWSEADTERLIDAIEQFGCSWSLIAKNVEFEHFRDQIALKDRARNMKVSYLKAQTVLPLNFENVRLGKKEIEAVRRCVPDYEP